MKIRLLFLALAILLLTGCSRIGDIVKDTGYGNNAGSQVCDLKAYPRDSMPGSCTTFAVQMGDQVLFGNNEDFENPMTYYWVIPSSEDGYGGIYLGYEWNRPQGGINEKGLAWDGLALDPPEPINPHPEKPTVSGPFTAFMGKVLRECADVEQAIEMLLAYNYGKVFGSQVLLADTSGDAAIIGPGLDGELAVTRKPAGDGYLLGTNFNVVQLADEGFEIPCWRYAKAQELLDELQQKGDLSVDAVFHILDEVHQEGRKNNTLYSNVFDLKNGVVYLTYWYQYDEVITLDVVDEVSKRTSTGEIPNSSDKVRLMTQFSDTTIAQAKQAYQRYLPAFGPSEIIAWVWVGLSLICVGILSVDLIHQTNLPWSIKLIWFIVVCFLGIAGLIVYHVSFKRPVTRSSPISKIIRALGSATVSVVGCTFTLFLILFAVYAVNTAANLGPLVLLIPYVISLTMFRAPMMATLYKITYQKGLSKYIILELISAIFTCVCFIFIDQYLRDYFNQYSRDTNSAESILFWAKFSVYAFGALIVVFLVHFLLVHLKVKLWPEKLDLKAGVSQEVV